MRYQKIPRQSLIKNNDLEVIAKQLAPLFIVNRSKVGKIK